MKNVYVIDACALIDAAKNYNMKKQTFSDIWETFAQMITDGELYSTIEVRDELKDEDLEEWSKLHKELFYPLTQEIQEYTKSILKNYPTLIKMTSKANSNADPFLIATAQVLNAIVVTNEKSGDVKNGNYKIPNVCNELNLECLNLQDFIDQIFD